LIDIPIDIPNIYALVNSGIIPRFEYTGKDVVCRLTGATFLAYTLEQTEINSIRSIYFRTS